jgi:hypothetical protein
VSIERAVQPQARAIAVRDHGKRRRTRAASLFQFRDLFERATS